MSRLALVCDTTLLLYLGRLDRGHWLPALFDPVYVPEPVAAELDMGRLMRGDTIDPRRLDWASLVAVSEDEVDALPPNRLGMGERAVIAYAFCHSGCLAGLDDRQARLVAQRMGLAVAGTIGVLLRAKQAGLTSSVRPLLDALQSAVATSVWGLTCTSKSYDWRVKKREPVACGAAEGGRGVQPAFIGVRPAEKLLEELFVAMNGGDCDDGPATGPPAELDAMVDRLIGLAQAGDRAAVVRTLQEIVPQYEPAGRG